MPIVACFPHDASAVQENLNLHEADTTNPHSVTAAQVGALPSSTTITDLGGIAATEKGAASGVATLGSDGKVPSAQLPSLDYIPTSQKGAASGVAELDSTGKVPSGQLPDTCPIENGAITTEKLANNAVATDKIVDGAVSKAKLAADAKTIYRTVTLGTTGWTSSGGKYTKSVTCTGVSATETDQLIQPVPAAASMAAYIAAGILAIGQAANSLTFQANEVPASSLTIYVAITSLTAAT